MSRWREMPKILSSILQRVWCVRAHLHLVTGWHEPFTYTQDAFASTTVERSLTDRKATGTER